jgi:hypothetical protein
MSERSGYHPTAVELQAFGLGQLESAVAQAIEEHVAVCTSCCESLLMIPDDALVVHLRQAAPSRETPSHSQSVETTAPFVPPGLHDASTLPHPAGSTWEPPTVPLPGSPAELAEHPRYRIVRLLGQGGMGAVYQAEHRVMERLVALKVIRREYTASTSAVERFRREVKAAARLQGMPFASRAPARPDFLRPTKDSSLMIGGVGGDLPSYAGAVPPAGVEAWDWDKTWKARVSKTKSP